MLRLIQISAKALRIIIENVFWKCVCYTFRENFLWEKCPPLFMWICYLRLQTLSSNCKYSLLFITHKTIWFCFVFINKWVCVFCFDCQRKHARILKVCQKLAFSRNATQAPYLNTITIVTVHDQHIKQVVLLIYSVFRARWDAPLSMQV